MSGDPAGDSAAYYQARGESDGLAVGQRLCFVGVLPMDAPQESAANRKREVSFWMRQASMDLS